MPKKGSKAALKKKQKAKPKAKQANKNDPQKTNEQVMKSVMEGAEDVTLQDQYIKEFKRDIFIPNFSVAPIGGGPPLIHKTELKITSGRRYGLIGYNGSGKTTMLHKLASGTIKEIPDYLSVLHVAQELEGNDQSVLQTVLASDSERETLLKEEKRLREAMSAHEASSSNTNGNAADPAADKPEDAENAEDENKNELSNEVFLAQNDRLNAIHERLKAINAETAEARASAVLTGLQFTDRMKNMQTKDLSGGWRMRVRLACALFLEPDVLLLDEPTNHLDFPSVIWLSEYLECDYPQEKTIMIVSHDRRFLNDVCTDIIHLDRCRLHFYKGNYESFLTVRSQMRTHQMKQYERQQKMIKHNEEFVARFKANKKWSTQAQSRMKMLSKLNKIEKVLSDLEFRFRFPDCPPLKNPNMFHLTNVDFGYFGEDDTGRSYLLKNVSLRLQKGSKVGIMGANGAGKSTLLRLIMNELQPIQGTAWLSNAVECGFFSQHHMEILDYNATPLEHLKNVFGDATVQQIYAQLGRFNLGDKFARRKIGTLSGGQKSRVAFCILTWYAPHLIVMDEPTNHLDMPTIDALAIALSDFDGSVLVVSHDQHFVETVCDEFWAVGNRTVKVFDDFNKCRDYAHKCKPIDVLPREFSTVHVRATKYTKSKDESKESELLMASKKGDANGGKRGTGAAGGGLGVFQVDPEREIDKGLAKDLAPHLIVRHLKGWKPVDGNKSVVNKLGFIVFHEYFDEKYKDIDANEFFERWQKLVCFCLPHEHMNNQLTLLDIAHQCWSTAAKKDQHPKATQAYGFGMIIEVMFRQDMITQEAVEKWREVNMSKLDDVVKKDLENFMEAANEDDDDDSDSD